MMSHFYFYFVFWEGDSSSSILHLSWLTFILGVFISVHRIILLLNVISHVYYVSIKGIQTFFNIFHAF